MMRSKKADKIAWAILGKPLPIKAKKTKKQEEVTATLDYQYTNRTR